MNIEEYDPIISVPCSKFKHLINDDWIMATSEFEAIMMAAGFAASGKKPLVFLQNSGIGDILDPMTSFLKVVGLEIPLVISHRGGPDDAKHHQIMGSLDFQILGLINAEYRFY